MNSKMTSVADEIGRSICKYYEEEYLDLLFSGNIVIEDVIFQILVECCRYAYLKNADKHSLKYYIDRDGMELELARKTLKRIIDYVNEHFEIEGKRLKESIGVDIHKPDVSLLADLAERNIPESRFFYWNSLKSFIDSYAKQHFDVIEAREALIADIEKNETGFLAPIQEFVKTKLIGCSLSGFDVMVPGNYETLKSLDFDGDPEIEEISELDNDNLLLDIKIDCIGVVSSKINDADIKEIEEYGLYAVVVGQNDDGMCDLETTMSLQVQLRAVYSKKAITSVEIDDIDDYNCPYCPY